MSRLNLFLVATSFNLMLGCAPTPPAQPKSLTAPPSKPPVTKTRTTNAPSTEEVLSQLPSENQSSSAQPPNKNGLIATINGSTFEPQTIELLKFKNPDRVTNGTTIDEAQKYQREIMDGPSVFDSKNIISIVFATDTKMALDGYTINWKPTKFGTPEAREQAYPNPNITVGRGIYAVNVDSPSGSDMISDEITATIQFGKSTATSQEFTIDLTVKNIKLKGSGTAKCR